MISALFLLLFIMSNTNLNSKKQPLNGTGLPENSTPKSADLSAENPELLITKLSLETAKIPWRELEVHFARGVVRQVHQLDLPQVGMELINNNAQQIEAWIASGKLGDVDIQAAAHWHKEDSHVWALVVAPWVLVQAID